MKLNELDKEQIILKLFKDPDISLESAISMLKSDNIFDFESPKGKNWWFNDKGVFREECARALGYLGDTPSDLPAPVKAPIRKYPAHTIVPSDLQKYITPNNNWNWPKILMELERLNGNEFWYEQAKALLEDKKIRLADYNVIPLHFCTDRGDERQYYKAITKIPAKFKPIEDKVIAFQAQVLLDYVVEFEMIHGDYTAKFLPEIQYICRNIDGKAPPFGYGGHLQDYKDKVFYNVEYGELSDEKSLRARIKKSRANYVRTFNDEKIFLWYKLAFDIKKEYGVLLSKPTLQRLVKESS